MKTNRNCMIGILWKGFGAALAAALLMTGCDAAASQPGLGSDARPRFVMALVDETASFEPCWQKSLHAIGKVVESLGPNEAFGLIGIDDRGFDPEDVRVPIQVIDPAVLKAHRQKRAWAANLATVQRRTHKRNYTDILGAVRHAAFFLNRQPDRNPVLLIFSDMEQTPQMPAVADVDFQLAGGARVYCFFVNTSGWADRIGVSVGTSWDIVVGRWQSILSSAGASVTKGNFYQEGSILVELPRLLARR